MDFFTRHAVSGVEQVTPDSYKRTIALGGAPGNFEIRPITDKHALRLELQLADHRLLMPGVDNRMPFQVRILVWKEPGQDFPAAMATCKITRHAGVPGAVTPRTCSGGA